MEAVGSSETRPQSFRHSRQPYGRDFALPNRRLCAHHHKLLAGPALASSAALFRMGSRIALRHLSCTGEVSSAGVSKETSLRRLHLPRDRFSVSLFFNFSVLVLKMLALT